MNLKLNLKFHQKVMVAVAMAILIINAWVATYLAASKQTTDPNFIKAALEAADMALLLVLAWWLWRQSSKERAAAAKPSP